MKARVKETGKEFKVRGILTPTADAYAIEEVDLFFDESDQVELLHREDYWIRLKHQYVGMAMNALLLTNNIRNGDLEGMRECNTNAMAIAHALVEKMKEEK